LLLDGFWLLRFIALLSFFVWFLLLFGSSLNASVTNASQGPTGVIASFHETHLAMNFSAKIDALQLMLTDLRTRNEPIRHKAAFRGCQPEFQALVSKLIHQLETELLHEKQQFREK
jgi:hypothetical protein